MALTATQTGIVQLVVSMFDAAPGKAFLDQFTADAEAGQSLNQLATNLALTTAYQTTYPDSLTDAEFAATFVGNILGDSVSADPLAWAIEWAEIQLNDGAPRTSLIQVAAQSLLDVGSNHADFGVASATFANKIQAASNYSETESSVDMDTLIAAIANVTEDESTVPDVISPSVEGETFDLTSSTDRITGTADDDTFTAFLAQNAFAGGVSNTLSSADVLDGGAGTDTLTAEIVPEFFGATGDNQIDVQPRTSNIEEVTFEARDAGSNSIDAAATDFAVSVDAKNMTDIDKIGSSFSDGDLIIENLTTLTSTGVARNTEELTITMDHTDNFNSDNDASDLTVYFDEDYLLAGESVGTSQANYWLLDELSEDYEVEPLLTIERTGFNLTIDGAPYTIAMEDDVAAAADTWEAFAAGIQAVIDASNDPVAEGLSVVVDYNNTDTTFNDAGVEVTIPAISIIDAQGRDLVPTGFTSPADVTEDFDIYGRFNNIESETSQNPVTINVELEKVGREGEGGDLVIGGKELDSDGGAEDQGNGINTFNIDVLGEADKLSNLGSINSTNNALETVNIATGAEFINSETVASLTIRDAFDNSSAVETVNANSFLGDLDIGEDNAALNVDTFTATGGGDVTYYAEIDGTEKGVFTNITGAGDDAITVALDGDAVDTTGTSFAVSTNGGDDSVTVNMDTADAGVSIATMRLLDNLDISTGAGEDSVNLNGYGTFDITAGAGSDYVRINSVDNNGNAQAGSWTVGDDTGVQTFGERVLYEAKLTISFAGFEETVTVLTTAADNFIATQASINAAITSAVEANPELTKLLTLTEGTGDQQLEITSNVGGENTLAIAIYQPELVATGAATDGTQVSIQSGDVSALTVGLIATESLTSAALTSATDIATATTTTLTDFYGSVDNTGAGDTNPYTTAEQTHDTSIIASDSNVDILDTVGAYLAYSNGGSSDTTLGFNSSTIDLGTGANDLVVLHSRDNNVNKIKITETFGKVSVVNFHNVSTDSITSAANVGTNALDFSTYLVDQTDPSANANTISAVDIADTVNIVNGANAYSDSAAGTNLALANSVNLIRFDSTADTNTFEALTANNLLAALNNTAGTATINYGNLTDGLLSAANAATGAAFVGTTQNHIVMIENDLNEGEYKIFHLTSTVDAAGQVNATADFATAVELGTIDFGASVNLNVVGSDEHTAALEKAIAAFEAEIHADLATIVNTDQTVSKTGTVVNAEGDTVGVSTIKTVSATLTATTEQALTMSGVTGGVTLSDVVGITFGTANKISAQFSTAITATIGDSEMSELELLAGDTTTNAYTIKVTDASVVATELTALAAKTSVAVDAEDVETLTGAAADVIAADGSAGLTLAADYDVVISDVAGTDIAATVLTSVDTANGRGNVTVTNAIDVTGTLTEVFGVMGALTGTANALISDGSITAADLSTLDTATAGTINDGGTLTITGLSGATVAATEAADTFNVLSGDTKVTISGFATTADKIALGGGSGAVAASDVANNDASTTLIFDLAANLGKDGDSIASASAKWAVASDTGAIYYDADGDWTADVVVVGTVTGTVVADDFLV